MKKRVGIIVDSVSVSQQISELVKLSESSKNYEITTLIINHVAHNNKNLITQIISYIKRRGFKKFLSNAIFKAVCKAESIVVKRSGKFAKFYNRVDLDEAGLNSITVNPLISKSGLVYRYGSDDMENIRKLKLDLLIRAESGILRGDILNVCPNGIISFHHADNEINRGGPPGFWEVYEKKPRTGFIIQRLKDELDGGDVLFKGYTATSWLYTLNLAKIYEIANPFFHQVLEDITSGNPKLEAQDKAPYSHCLYTAPNLLQIANYLLKTLFVLSAKVSRKIQRKAFRWGVAYQFSTSWNDVTLWRSQKITNPKNRFLADPFVIKKGDAHFCFVEDYDYRTQKGSISAYKIYSSGHESVGVVLDEDFHLSYPFIFEYDNDIYMCPETHEKKEIRIYKCLEFPNKWEFHKTLMRDVSAVDTNIFEYNGKWWLFTNFERSVVEDHDCQLHIFYSDSPLTDKWVAHEANPVIFDPLLARNGGIIINDSEVYRVFQRQGFDMYGEACGIAKIVNLSATDYKEEVCATIEPKFFNNIKGTHTYNFNSNLIVLDYVEVSKVKTGA